MLRRVRLRNFKCFREQDISLSGLTLFTGLNGMGKSTVIQSLLLLRQSFLDGLSGTNNIELNGPLVAMGTGKDVLCETAQDESIEILLEGNGGSAYSFVFDCVRDADVLQVTKSISDHEVFSDALFRSNFHYLQAERLGPRISYALSDHHVRGRHEIGASGEYVGHYLKHYGEEPVRAKCMLHPDAKSDDLASQVEAWLHHISPGVELNIQTYRDMDVVSLRYSYVDGTYRSNQYRSTSVGFGISYVLPVITALLSSTAGSLVLVENPEAHLHPSGQVSMGRLLAYAAAAGIQVIVETHSDHVLNGVRVAVHSGSIEPEHVTFHYFGRALEDDTVRCTVVSPIIDRNGRLDIWPDGFFDEWDKSLDRLLRPRGD